MKLTTSQLVLLAVFATAVGDFAYRTWKAPAVPEYQVTNQSPPLAAPSDEARTKHLYLRRNWNFTEAPAYAWLQVIGHDSVQVFVNGQQIGQSQKVGSNRVGAVLVDMTSCLHEGKNTIAIHARQLTRDRAPLVAIDGECRFLSGDPVLITSGDGWLASAVYDRRGLFWYETDYPDNHWAAPTALDMVTWKAQVPLPAGSITTPRTAKWITPTETNGGAATVATEFQVPATPNDAWLRIASTSPYRLAVNGWVVVNDRLELATDTEGQVVEKTMDLTRFLQPGKNTLSVAVDKGRGVPRIEGELHVTSGEEPITVVTDQEWKSQAGIVEGWTNPQWSDTDWQSCREEPGMGGIAPRSLKRDFQSLESPPLASVLSTVQWLAAVAAAFLAALLSCKLVTWLVHGTKPSTTHSSSSTLAYWALLPSAVLAVAAGLMTWDLAWTSRDVYQWGYLLLLVLLPCALWVGLLLLSSLRPVEHGVSSEIVAARSSGQFAFWCAWILLVIFAGWLRLEWIADEAIHHDEVSDYNFTMSIFEYGFPAIRVHEDLPTSYCSTSELSYYFNALGALFVDDPRLVVRLPAAFWSMATLVLIGFVGTKWFNAYAGFLAGFFYAVSPHAISMANFGRYLSEVQFFTLLTTYFAFEAIRGTGKLRPGYVWAAGLSFVAMYLSWEGSGLYAIGLVLAALLHRRRHLMGLLTTPAVYYTTLLVAVVIVAQNSHRILQQTHRMWYGTGISSLKLEPMWRFPSFDADFYLLNSSWTRDALFPTLVVLAALILSIKHRWRMPIRFLLMCLLGNAGLMAALLPLKTNRYAYHLTEITILLAGASLVAMVEGVYHAVRVSQLPALKLYANSIVGVTLAVALAVGSGWLIDASELKSFVVAAHGPHSLRSPDWEEASRYVQENYQAGDVVISILPHAQEFQFKVMAENGEQPIPVDYWLETKLILQATIGDTEEVPRDRRSGAVMLYDLEQLKQLFAEHERIWYCTNRFGQSEINDSVVSQFLREHMDVVHEDIATSVMLRDRNHRPAEVRFEEQEAGTLASDFYLK